MAPAPVPSIVADPFDDPFSDKFNQQKPHPLPVAPTPAPSMANVFENNPFADSEALPPAPANVHKADDFELFLQSTATAVPPPAPAPASQTQPSAVPAAAEEDFDAFFANLNK